MRRGHIMGNLCPADRLDWPGAVLKTPGQHIDAFLAQLAWIGDKAGAELRALIYG